MSLFGHGDDFVVSREPYKRKQFSKHLIVEHLATVGTFTEVRILNRIVRWVKPSYGSGSERVEYGADPPHAELIIRQLSGSSRSVSTPSEKSKPGVGPQHHGRQCGPHFVWIGHEAAVLSCVGST